MAGQKMYDSLTLTTAKGLVHVTGAVTVNCATATGSATLTSGNMLSVSGANGVVTVTLPEKYGTCESLQVNLVDSGTATGNRAVITTDYSPSAGTFVFSILSSAAAAVTTGTFKVYLTGDFALGM